MRMMLELQRFRDGMRKPLVLNEVVVVRVSRGLSLRAAGNQHYKPND